MTPYRPDIDGLRGVAVLIVILYHAGVGLTPGGYVGVDVFFVVSGFLITSLVMRETSLRQFTLKSFYVRRIARIAPSLLLTLMLSLAFGFVFYDPPRFDNLGREAAFSALGASNILYSRGVNYFAADPNVRPLLHTWSLGIEEQFYLLWPLTILLLLKFSRRWTSATFAALALLSLLWSEVTLRTDPTAAYFLPHLRAFELLIGAQIGHFSHRFESTGRSRSIWRDGCGLIGAGAIAVGVFAYDETTAFPGIAALLPCAGTAAVILPGGGTIVARLFAVRPLVLLGLISYPLYLLHLPLLTWMQFLGLKLRPEYSVMAVLAIGLASAALLYRYVETPLRRRARRADGKPIWAIGTLLVLAVLFAGIGLHIAKFDGWPWRFKILNAYAYEVSMRHKNAFYRHFTRGFHVNSTGDRGTVLLLGDSVMEQYVVPISSALGADLRQVDTVTRGGCVLLQGVDFKDNISDISCNELRSQLYGWKRKYDVVVIAQDWAGYANQVRNFPKDLAAGASGPAKWLPFLAATIGHFAELADRIVVLGWGPEVSFPVELSPTLFADAQAYRKALAELEVTNRDGALAADAAFAAALAKHPKVTFVSPFAIWCGSNGTACRLHDGTWSYFRDERHTTAVGDGQAADRIRRLLGPDR
jgi:peptidoglycan/LPS O-acetylase OafA/YrhL